MVWVGSCKVWGDREVLERPPLNEALRGRYARCPTSSPAVWRAIRPCSEAQKDKPLGHRPGLRGPGRPAAADRRNGLA